MSDPLELSGTLGRAGGRSREFYAGGSSPRSGCAKPGRGLIGALCGCIQALDFIWGWGFDGQRREFGIRRAHMNLIRQFVRTAREYGATLQAEKDPRNAPHFACG